MSTQPTPRSNLVELLLGLPYGQFQGAPVIDAKLASYGVQAQEIENVLVDVLVLSLLPNATGEQLDVLGRIVGEPRQGKNDADYAIAIAARIRINRTNATIEDILLVLVAAIDRTYEVDDLGNAAFIVRVVDSFTTAEAEILKALLEEAKGGGVRADLVWSLVDDDATFTLASGDVEEASTTQGTANDAATVGGALADVL
jgi:hypothetical protein